jgi:hypothetical protein
VANGVDTAIEKVQKSTVADQYRAGRESVIVQEEHNRESADCEVDQDCNDDRRDRSSTHARRAS